LCSLPSIVWGISGGRYTTTIEVYPVSPRATSERCNAAQVAAVLAKSVAEAKLIRRELDRLA